MDSLSSPARLWKHRLWCALVSISLLQLLIPVFSPAASGNGVAISMDTPTASTTSVLADSGPASPRTFSLTGTEHIHLLLIGQDRSAPGIQGRSDTILLCTLHRSRQQLVLTSFLRDLYVSIPGYGQNRINAAYAFGGADLLSQTLKENFGILPDGYLEADFSGFSKISFRLGCSISGQS